MKVLVESRDFCLVGAKETIKFQVKNNAAMMRKLSDDLYSDKILAPIRELSANALDSHIRVGKADKPFAVHLPTFDNPEFYIRDYGKGMSRQEMEEIYPIYGESDKTDSNDEIGCLGLGSKSPLAYVNSFTAISYHNGEKHTYIVSKDDKNEVVLAYMGSVDTTEPNGMDISFLCEVGDIADFKRKAKEVYQWFDVKPTFVCGTEIDFVNEEWLIERGNNNWALRGINTNTDSLHRSYVIMGNIAYPLSSDAFINLDKDDTTVPWKRKNYYQNNGYYELIKSGIVIWVKMGTVDFDLGRERLSYSKSTVSNLRKEMDGIIQTVQLKVDEEFEKCKNLYEARLLAQKYSSNLTLSGYIKPKYKHYDLSNTYISVPNITEYSLNYNDKLQNYQTTSLYVRENNVFIVKDIDDAVHKTLQRIKHFIKTNNNNKNVYFIDLPKEQLKILIENVGFDESYLTKLSTLEVPEVVKVKQQRKKLETILEFDIEKCRNFAYKNQFPTAWKSAEVDFDDGGYYIEISAGNIVVDSNMFPPYRLKKICEFVKENKITSIPKVYGVKTISLAKYKKSKKWINFFDHVKKEVINYLESNKILDRMSDVLEYNLYSGYKQSIPYKLYLTKEFDNKSIIVQHFDKVYDIEMFKETHKEILSEAKFLSDVFGLETKITSTSTLSTELRSIYEKYPLLEAIPYWNYSTNEKDIIKYVKLIDGENHVSI